VQLIVGGEVMKGKLEDERKCPCNLLRRLNPERGYEMKLAKRFKPENMGNAVAVVIGVIVLVMAFMTGSHNDVIAAEKQQRGTDIRVLPAAESPPPEISRMEEKVPAAPSARSSREELIERLRKQPGALERVRKAKSGKPGKLRLATASPPPEVRKLEEAAVVKVPKLLQERPNLEELLEKIRKQPKGIERIDLAKKGRRPGQRSHLERGESILAGLNPFRIDIAQAAESFTLKLKPRTDRRCRLSGLESGSTHLLNFFGGNITPNKPTNGNIWFESSPNWKSDRPLPFALLRVRIPANGWYIVSCLAYAHHFPAEIILKHYHWGGTIQLEIFNQEQGVYAYTEYPTLQYLEMGNHYFTWHFQKAGYLSMISVVSFP
jgi:hypothetical protein